jgi:glutamyl-tRNA reductase
MDSGFGRSPKGRRPLHFHSGPLSVALIGTSFRTSPIEFRERLVNFLFDNYSDNCSRLGMQILEYVPLITCNRVEMYFVTPDPERVVSNFMYLLERSLGESRSLFYIRSGQEAIHHIFRVAAGLDSLVVGEDQILVQLRQAGIAARLVGSSRSVLPPLFDAAVNVGRRVRALQSHRDSAKSISSFAMNFALGKLGRQPNEVLLVGTGKIARLALLELKGSKVYVATKRKKPLVGFAGAVFIPYRRISAVARKCDLIITATKQKDYIIKAGDLTGELPSIILDLGFPRNVDPKIKSEGGRRVYDIDDLARYELISSVNNRSHEDAEKFVSSEAEDFAAWLVASKLSSSLAKLYRWAEDIRLVEIMTARRRLNNLDGREKRVLESMSRRLVSKILAPATVFVKGSSAELSQQQRLELVERMFGFDVRDE